MIGDFFEDNLEWVIGIVVVLMIVGIFFAAKDEDDHWQKYAAQHHCEVKGHSVPSNGIGFGSKGQPVVTYNPGQTIYVCDGGEIQMR